LRDADKKPTKKGEGRSRFRVKSCLKAIHRNVVTYQLTNRTTGSIGEIKRQEKQNVLEEHHQILTNSIF